ncbi:MAG: hypothetical protein IJ022_07710 [Burkholderiaceae bacterium]|nr:hypothetical protein [Burkholderiaceae bacterium]
MKNTELQHWGIKGMKWGVRRYQNKDGTLTPAGKKRYDNDTRELSDKKKEKYVADPDKWVKDDLQAGRKLADETSNLTNKLKSVNDSKMRNHPKVKMDLSSMSDQQMRNEINRAILEKQYNDMFAPQKSNTGRRIVSNILETTGTVLAIGSSALGIALAIKELKS